MRNILACALVILLLSAASSAASSAVTEFECRDGILLSDPVSGSMEHLEKMLAADDNAEIYFFDNQGGGSVAGSLARGGKVPELVSMLKGAGTARVYVVEDGKTGMLVITTPNSPEPMEPAAETEAAAAPAEKAGEVEYVLPAPSSEQDGGGTHPSRDSLSPRSGTPDMAAQREPGSYDEWASRTRQQAYEADPSDGGTGDTTGPVTSYEPKTPVEELSEDEQLEHALARQASQARQEMSREEALTARIALLEQRLASGDSDRWYEYVTEHREPRFVVHDSRQIELLQNELDKPK
ncbi:MAG: hypothetical protein ACLFOY_04415 [Desulfatibacillaceae bacterium]